MGIINRKTQYQVRIHLKKKCKIVHQKKLSVKNLFTGKRSHKLNFSVTVLLKKLFGRVFAPFLKDSKSVLNSAFLYPC